MGVINITPDSFSDGGRFLDSERAEREAAHQLRSGADVLDLGARAPDLGRAKLALRRNVIACSSLCERFGANTPPP